MNDETMKIKIKLENHDEQIKQHSIDIDKLKEDVHEDRIKQAEMYVKLDNLVESVQNLTNTMKWLLFGLIGTLSGFFIYAIQNKLF